MYRIYCCGKSTDSILTLWHLEGIPSELGLEGAPDNYKQLAKGSEGFTQKQGI